MTGVCIEDVNHEIYGGIYSQMIFGESFQEPPADADRGVRRPSAGPGSSRTARCRAAAGDGPKLVAESPAAGDGRSLRPGPLPGRRGRGWRG